MAIEVLLSEVTESILRAGDFHATKGGNGVALPTDLQVRAMDVPGTSVQVVRGPSGSAALVDPRPSRGAQTYITVASETELVPVPATDSSGGKTRYIIQYVDDGNAPGAYFACVDSLAEYVLVPHVVLAKIVQPASRADIQPGMIDDSPREVANPRMTFVTRIHNMASGQSVTLTNTEAYPSGGTFPVATEDAWGAFPIPTWATRMHVAMNWSGVIDPGGDVAGYVWVQVGPTVNPDHVVTEGTLYDTQGGSPQSGYFMRAAGELDVPVGLRGTSQKIYPRGNVTYKDAGPSQLRLDARSTVDVTVMFLEVAIQGD